MLVLTRGRNDKVIFPTLGISVDVLRVAGNKVRLGIDAPKEIPIVRHEISVRKSNLDSKPRTLPFPGESHTQPARLNHSIRNRLNSAALGLHYLHRMLEEDKTDDAEATIFRVFSELKSI